MQAGRLGISLTLAGLILLSGAAPALADPPPNDDFSAAQPITPAALPASVNGDTTDATTQSGEITPYGNTVWFTWVAPATTVVRSSVCFSGRRLRVYQGDSHESLTEVSSLAENANFPRTECDRSFHSTAGQTYRFVVGGTATLAEGPFTLSLRVLTPPANDNFADREDLGNGLTPSASGSNVDATKETGETDNALPFFFGPGATVWFGWTPPATGQYRFGSCTADFWNMIRFYSATTVDTLGEGGLGANHCDGSPTLPGWYFTATKGSELKFAVDGTFQAGLPYEGSFSFSIEPTDDIFAAATDLGNGATASATGSNGSYSKEPGEPNHAGRPGVRSKWFKWTAPLSDRYILDLCDSDFDTLLGVYTGSAVDALTQVASDDNGCNIAGEAVSRLELQAVAGTTYRIAVDSPTHEHNSMVELELWRVAHDRFDDARDLGNGTLATASDENRFATKEAGEPQHAGNPGGASVWYRWTSPVTDQVTIDTCDSDFDTLLGVYTGSAVNSLTTLAGNDDGCDPWGTSVVSFDAVAGTDYRIAVDGFHNDGAPQPIRGSIELNLVAGPPPDTDEDGVNDFEDNCPEVANADQADFDEDYEGDVCDDDVDGDLVDDSFDACPREWGESVNGCPLRLLVIDVTGPGSVTVGDFLGEYNCPLDFCEALYDDSETATLTATPNPGASLASLSGPGCSGSGCVVTLDQDLLVEASFVATPLQPPLKPPTTPKKKANTKKKKCKRSRKGRRCSKTKSRPPNRPQLRLAPN